MLKKSLLRSAVLLRWQVRGSPSVANPLSGIKLHRSFILFRFAHGLFDSRPPWRSPCRAPSAPNFVPDKIVSSQEWHREVPLTDRRMESKKRGFALLHFSNTSVFEKCAVPPCTALAGCKKWFFSSLLDHVNIQVAGIKSWWMGPSSLVPAMRAGWHFSSPMTLRTNTRSPYLGKWRAKSPKPG